MAVAVTLESVQSRGERYYVTFSDGMQQEFATLAEMTTWVNELEDVALARRFLIGWWIARDEDANNPQIVEGKTCTLELSDPNPVKVT